MDGTITPPRKEIEGGMALLLRELSKIPVTLGIVSGSPWEYLEQQMSSLWTSSAGLGPDSLVIMPCNGTKLMRWEPDSGKFDLRYEVNFKEYMNNLAGKNVYIEFVKHILELQIQFVHEYQFENLTGNFLSYRESMINWSPVGRDAQDKERSAFVKLDQESNVRNKLREFLRVRLDASGLHETELNLGGSTSIDIHPVGWDKTHALRHFDDQTIFLSLIHISEPTRPY